MPPSPVLFRCRIWRSRGAATAAATAAAEAAVQAVMRTLSRKSPAGDPKKEQNHSSGSWQEKTLVLEQGQRTSRLRVLSGPTLLGIIS